MNPLPRHKALPRRKALARRRRHLKRRRRFGALLVALLALSLGAAYVSIQASDDALLARLYQPSSEEKAPSPSRGGSPKREEMARAGSKAPPAEERPAPDPRQDTPEAAAYVAVAPEMPGVGPESIKSVYLSRMDGSWASVRVAPKNEGKDFIVFARKDQDSWVAEKSIRVDEPDHAKNDVVSLAGVPKDLIEYLYTENLFAAKTLEPRRGKIDPKSLPSVEPPEFPPADPVTDGVPASERERVEKALGKAAKEIKGYPGVAGVYVRELDGDFGYGIRPDERFFSASVIKVPVMVAVYRKVDEGELDFSQQVRLEQEDWAAGAGWLQWEGIGKKHAVGDLLFFMMTQSDNVATNALIRKVGGADHVNEVARSLGARDTQLYQKVSSERAAVPGMDNRTTPRDMAAMLQKIADGEAASKKSCENMIALMKQNVLDQWFDYGIPDTVSTPNKVGWLYQVFNDVGIVEHKDRRYVAAIMSKYGTNDANRGSLMIGDVSRFAWEAQVNPKKRDPDKENEPGKKKRDPDKK